MLFARSRNALPALLLSLAFLTVGYLAFLTVGCGKEAKPTIDIAVYPAQGKLLVGGKPYSGISIVLGLVQDTGARPRPGQPVVRAITGEDGSFFCSTTLIKTGVQAQQASGAPPGEYVVVCLPEREEDPLLPAFQSGPYSKYVLRESTPLRAT